MGAYNTSDFRRAKERLAGVIAAVTLSRVKNQTQAAELLDIDQPTVSRLARERTERFSFDRLFQLLNLLDRDVEIRVRPKSRRGPRGRVRVV